MIDIVVPNNNEEELLETALKFGWNGLCFLYKKPTEAKLKNCYSALLNRTGKADLVVFEGSSAINKQCDVVFNLEKSAKKDILQIHSGLNHVLAKKLAEKGKIVCFNFSLLKKDQEAIMGRMMQNIKLCQKYKVKMAIASFAHFPDEMRNPSDIESLFRLLGMRNPKKALNAVEEKIQLNIKKRKGIVLKEGIERV